MQTQDSKTVTTNADNWVRVQRLEADVAGLQVDVQYIRTSIDQLMTRQNRQFPFGPVVSLVSVLVIVLGGFATMLTAPIAELTSYNREQIELNQSNDQADHSQLAVENAYLKGRLETLEERVEEIDIYGSRRWNNGVSIQ
jgi:hypothetical protein